MDERALGPGSMPEITDDNLVEARPRVRAMIVGRWEQMWAQVDRHMAEADAGDRMLDPRMLEIGRGILRAQTELYLLLKPVVAAEEEEEVVPLVDRREAVEARLLEIEAKLRGHPEQGQDPAGPAAA